MRIVAINTVNYGSTGKIMLQIADAVRAEGNRATVCCAASRQNYKTQDPDQIFIGDRVSRNIHLILAKYTGLHDCFSIFSTLRFLKKINEIKPDIIHLHNLHIDYINLSLLFSYIKKHQISVVWTLHDCWAFTGHCPYFTLTKCDKWKTGCHHCPSYREYPISYVDLTKPMWKLKKKWFTGIKNMTIVTPSQWLSDLVKQSFLKEYPVKVINNGIDLDVFKPSDSDFRNQYVIPEKKYIVLGLALGWEKRKGLDVFIELSKRLDPEMYQIVLVGTDETIDKQLPATIMSIHRTNSQQELAEIYTAADVFLNPTREDNFPTVNIEAIACGTPVITFDSGGSPECLDEKCGRTVECDDIDTLEKEIIQVCKQRVFSKTDCTDKAKEYDKNQKFLEYVDLFHSINNDKESLC